MNEERKKLAWPRIVAGLIGLPLLYVASFGPACWWLSPEMASSGPWKFGQAPWVFWPIGWAVEHGPDPVRHSIAWYATAVGDWTSIRVDTDWDGKVTWLNAPRFAK